MKLFEMKLIKGCDARGDGDSPYLTRITFLKSRFGQLSLHIFHRSDSDELHDHPWNFWTLILWRGYWEETPDGWRRLRPGRLVYRPATYRHRVKLLNERPAVTLVLMGPRIRDWGIFTPRGWQHWREYFKENGCK